MKMEKVAIWGNSIPGNSAKSKLDDMEIDRNKGGMELLVSFIKALTLREYHDEKVIIDTFTWKKEIEPGKAKETYEDVPYLTPFPVEGSKKAVIVVPGGGFAYLSSDDDPEGLQAEGDLVAKALNDRGISAFVLWYRLNPYHFPIPFMDLQRAIRYLRFHAKEYGFDPQQISAIGFSAGGFSVAAMLGKQEGRTPFPENYIPDEIDRISDHLNAAALIYPALGLDHNVSMLFVGFPGTDVRNAELRAAHAWDYRLLEQINSRHLPYFICTGTDDHLISVPDTQKYAELLRKEGIPVTYVPVVGADHGFGANPEAMKKYGYWLEKYLDWVQQET